MTNHDALRRRLDNLHAELEEALWTQFLLQQELAEAEAAAKRPLSYGALPEVELECLTCGLPEHLCDCAVFDKDRK